MTEWLGVEGWGLRGQRWSLLTSVATPIPIGTLKSIIEGSGLSVDDFR